MNREQVIELLRTECERAGSQVNFARQHKLSNTYIHDVLVQRNRVLGPKILKALGLKRQDNYVPIRRKK
jgi:hypothetical protein